ncbi:MAG: oxidoreductase-like protein [Candidatus Competibacteraceae bacterium]|nr:MAG: oxidoreductase-like protein [Candidatus Competibacteraceae bacterium]
MTAKPIDHDPQPQPPAPPVEGECCGRGCEFCVWVYYDQALRRHEAALAQWRERQTRGGNEESG